MTRCSVPSQHAEEEFSLEEVHSCPLCSGQGLTALDEEFHTTKCASCGFVFENPRPTLESIVRFYSKPTKYDAWIEIRGPYDRLWKRRLNRMLSIAKRGSLLDVGCGIGQFLSVARPYFLQVYGTEVSESGVAVAKSQFGIEVMHGQVETLDLPLGFYDNITLFHVLEHVADPLALLRRCSELLAPGGMLWVCVPNDVLAFDSRLTAMYKRMKRRNFDHFSAVTGLPRLGTTPEIHLCHFTPATLTYAVEKAGFEVQEVGLDPYFASKPLATIRQYLSLAMHSVWLKVTGTNRYVTIWCRARKKQTSH